MGAYSAKNKIFPLHEERIGADMRPLFVY